METAPPLLCNDDGGNTETEGGGLRRRNLPSLISPDDEKKEQDTPYRCTPYEITLSALLYAAIISHLIDTNHHILLHFFGIALSLNIWYLVWKRYPTIEWRNLSRRHVLLGVSIVIVYIIVGIIISILKLMVFLHRKEITALYINVPDEQLEAWKHDYIMSKHDMIIRWAIYWPFSIINVILEDGAYLIFLSIYAKLSDKYIRIGSWVIDTERSWFPITH